MIRFLPFCFLQQDTSTSVQSWEVFKVLALDVGMRLTEDDKKVRGTFDVALRIVYIPQALCHSYVQCFLVAVVRVLRLKTWSHKQNRTRLDYTFDNHSRYHFDKERVQQQDTNRL